MRKLDRYLINTVGSMIVLAAVGIVGILSIFTFLEQIEDLQNNYDVYAILMFCFYSMPRMFYESIPYAALIGCLSGLGLLAGNSELVVMRAAGVSTWAISLSALKPTLVLVIFGLFVGEYFLPDIERIARNDRIKALSDESQITPKFGLWYREGNVYMHFDEVGQGVLGGVSHYYFDDENRMTTSLYAARAVFHDVREDEQYWLMEDVIVTDIMLSRGSTETRHLTSLRWDTGLEPDLLRTEILVQPERMSIGELNTKIQYLQAQGLNSRKFELGYWQKVLQPVATIALVFVAISFIFGPLRESTMGVRIVTGLVIGIVFKFSQDLLSPASLVFGFHPLIAIGLPILVCLGFGYILLRRAG
ncbi:MAG: LPS export ABC transporter permease LptG [Pseudomonadales bacterium]